MKILVFLVALAALLTTAGTTHAAGPAGQIARYGGCWSDQAAIARLTAFQDRYRRIGSYAKLNVLKPIADLDQAIAYATRAIQGTESNLASAPQMRASIQGNPSAYAFSLAEFDRETENDRALLPDLRQFLATLQDCKTRRVAACGDLRLDVQGGVPDQIGPGDRVTIRIGPPDSGAILEMEISLAASRSGVSVSGSIRNVGGQCTVSTSQPIRLHPIATGLSITWHAVPDGIYADPTLRPGQAVSFSKTYSSDYKAGFNLRTGTFFAQD